MADRAPATYRHSTIANHPNPSRKTTSGKTVSLTPAETRVLTLLPTYRTLAAIGTQLGIGRPTVKTHVASIYKKLGATKRAEAVTLAETAGLLPRPWTEVATSSARPSRRENARPERHKKPRMSYHDDSR